MWLVANSIFHFFDFFDNKKRHLMELKFSVDLNAKMFKLYFHFIQFNSETNVKERNIFF